MNEWINLEENPLQVRMISAMVSLKITKERETITKMPDPIILPINKPLKIGPNKYTLYFELDR